MAPARTLTYLAQEKTLDFSFVRDEDERPRVAYNKFSNEIPIISLDEVDGGLREEICNKIRVACEEWGIFQIVDHGVDQKFISQMTRLAKEFFHLPPEDKLRFDMSGGKKCGFRVSSHLQAEPVQDWREIMIYFSYPIGERDYSRWPNKPEGSRRATEQYSEKLMGFDMQVVGGVIRGYGVRERGSYKDGLQATKDNGKIWITVQPVEGAFVVNLGDHFHYLSNGRFKNADHHQAVVNSNYSRLSIATFQNPAPDAIVHPLKVREGEKPVLEEPITFVKMYRRKMSKDLEIARLKKLGKEKELKELE